MKRLAAIIFGFQEVGAVFESIHSTHGHGAEVEAEPREGVGLGGGERSELIDKGLDAVVVDDADGVAAQLVGTDDAEGGYHVEGKRLVRAHTLEETAVVEDLVIGVALVGDELATVFAYLGLLVHDLDVVGLEGEEDVEVPHAQPIDLHFVLGAEVAEDMEHAVDAMVEVKGRSVNHILSN